MDLIADIGNTNIKIGIFDENNKLIDIYIFQRENIFNLNKIFINYKQIKRCIFSSVVNSNEDFLKIIKEHITIIKKLDHLMNLPFEILYNDRASLGKDRIADISGAMILFPQKNIFIIDAGTALNYELLLSERTYIGGHISPGLKMRFQSLHDYTEKLPLVSLSEKPFEIGNDTISCIQTGVQSGLIHEINGFIDYYENKFKNLTIILTGGDYKFFENKLKKTIFVEPNLSLYGLKYLLDYNDY